MKSTHGSGSGEFQLHLAHICEHAPLRCDSTTQIYMSCCTFVDCIAVLNVSVSVR